MIQQTQRILQPSFICTNHFASRFRLYPYSRTAKVTVQKRRFRLISLQEQNELEKNYNSDVTLYIKGFLTKKSDPENYQNWLSSHNKLVNEKGWGREAKAFFWGSEKPTMFPIVSLAWLGSRLLKLGAIHPVGLLRAAFTDLALYGVQIMNECRNIDKNIAENQGPLEDYLMSLNRQYRTVRVVAHSAGCKLVVKTIPNLPFSERPHYVHLCAPAVIEDDVSDWESLAQISTSVYFCEQDTILKAAHLFFWGGESVGWCVWLEAKLSSSVLSKCLPAFGSFFYS